MSFSLAAGLSFLAQQPAQPMPACGGPDMLIMMVVIVGIFWLFIIRPQKKQQQQLQQMLNSLKKNDKVMTQAGIIGWVDVPPKEDKTTVTLKVCEKTGARIEVLRQSITQVLTERPDVDEGDDSKD